VRGKNDEGVHAALLPGAKQVVHPAVQRLASHRGIARIRAFRDGVDAVCDGGRPQDTEAGREVIGKPLND